MSAAAAAPRRTAADDQAVKAAATRAAFPPRRVVIEAIRVKRALRGSRSVSELAELWDEGNDAAFWRVTLRDLAVALPEG